MLEEQWENFMNNTSVLKETTDMVPKEVPLCGDIVISTKTKILYFNINIDLHDIFWKLNMISYDTIDEGIIKNK